MPDYKFWTVWRSEPPMVGFEYRTEREARAEAQRLAGLDPESRYYVLQSVGFYLVPRRFRTGRLPTARCQTLNPSPPGSEGMAAEYDVSGWVACLLDDHCDHRGRIMVDEEQLIKATIRALSDPAREGSEEVLKAIMRKREATK
jgi:hypothetical protein